MIKEIVKDRFFLSRKSLPATCEDTETAQNLIDTITAHRGGCVGMAANMIGVAKRIIVFEENGKYTVMFNPEILKGEGEYTAEEGCLSLDGTRKTKRFSKIRVQYEDELLRKRIKNYSGFTAQIIQHEIDHCNGIII